ncbi:MAG: hypothetical protein R3C03_14205 [Pirellulaceae bacterium]
MMEEHFPTLVDYEFTAQLEDRMDAISRREADSNEYLQQFYFGNGRLTQATTVKTKSRKSMLAKSARSLWGAP